MPVASSASTTARRGVLGGAASLLAFATAVSYARPAVASPDAEVCRVAGLMVDGRAEIERHMEPYYDAVRFEYPPGTAARMRLLNEQHRELRDRLAVTPAASFEGWQAKARALLLWLTPGGDADVPTDPDQRLVLSLCRDLLAGRAA
ncbi:hypothetical protein M0638_27280 [Roseomonas sp. NAR14]|uniref:Uncharacterized protein n=1 Tax=Roseomonas acroporae TaxID=2937791 RepID=A0A9X1YFR6_9PROT|nr:hypothetical protein [Roseomonas acroporae]MCK8788063.1 hypothetical protein [Roseomonas acroporae]